MARSCRADQVWDALLTKCLDCHTTCKRPDVNPRCTSYCESAHCKAQPGHYYDGLLKLCVRCSEVCGRHPAECFLHCQTLPPPGTTENLLVQGTSHMPNPRGLSVLEDSTIYSLLALCMVLLLSSLSLALVVLLRGAKAAKTSNPGPKEANHNQESMVQMGQEVGQLGQSSKDFLTNSNVSTDSEPSYDSTPTETCVCIHCFPDLKALGQGNDRPTRAPLSFYQQAVLHSAQIQKGGPVWTEGNPHTSGLEVQEEASVG
ncbi:tumor necrosis factor receptor superfamily member 13B isoform X1 [Sebastes umbrosus]|uniref:tumor necrosis factor receptor superfamily member 13B isoform X1 n=1 Tax=Sebastes umbrosus TaxID=72105 RepID=UPI00189D3105|nr:tumor necrosis factor receptor superfamily member 13B isoform X1 [Sebastes umbrosus]